MVVWMLLLFVSRWSGQSAVWTEGGRARRQPTPQDWIPHRVWRGNKSNIWQMTYFVPLCGGTISRHWWMNTCSRSSREVTTGFWWWEPPTGLRSWTRLFSGRISCSWQNNLSTLSVCLSPLTDIGLKPAAHWTKAAASVSLKLFCCQTDVSVFEWIQWKNSWLWKQQLTK